MFSDFAPALSSLQLPLRIELPEKQPLELGPAPQVTLRVLDPALLAGDAPGLDELAAAWRDHRIELDGPIMQVVEVAARLGAAGGGPGTGESLARDGNLPGDFFRLWLDPELVPSCAHFETGSMPLAAAQVAQLRRLCRRLRLQPGATLLDAGGGWGALARLAAREFGVKVLALVDHPQQLALGNERIRAEGLQGHVQLELAAAYTPPRGHFDGIVAIGLLGAGISLDADDWPRLQQALRPGGLLLRHALTVHKNKMPAPAGGDFMRRHLFAQNVPAALPQTLAALETAGLEVIGTENLHAHQLRTLECWSANLERHLPQARHLLPAPSLRLWRLYLAGCACAARQGWLQLHEIVARKPGN
jgi:cyclopropane-fatty-acyl-phospholipid synthase